MIYLFKCSQGQLIIENIVNNIQYWEKFYSQFSWNEIYEFVEISSDVLDTFRKEKLVILQNWICENLTNNNLNIYDKCRLLGFLPKLVLSQYSLTNKDPSDINIK